MALTKICIIVALAVGASFAQTTEPAKPLCEEQTHGMLWPVKSARAAGTPVEICGLKGSRYMWQKLTVDISELKLKAAAKASGARRDTDRTPSDSPARGE